MIRSLLTNNEEDVPYMWIPISIGNIRFLWSDSKPKEVKDVSTQTETDLTDYVIVKYYKSEPEVSK